MPQAKKPAAWVATRVTSGCTFIEKKSRRLIIHDQYLTALEITKLLNQYERRIAKLTRELNQLR